MKYDVDDLYYVRFNYLVRLTKFSRAHPKVNNDIVVKDVIAQKFKIWKVYDWPTVPSPSLPSHYSYLFQEFQIKLVETVIEIENPQLLNNQIPLIRVYISLHSGKKIELDELGSLDLDDARRFLDSAARLVNNDEVPASSLIQPSSL